MGTFVIQKRPNYSVRSFVYFLRILSSMPPSKAPRIPHTITTRFRAGIRNFPSELFPLVVVVTAGLSAGVFAAVRKMRTDPTLKRRH
ncbi:53_t:CDS:2 [Paraglomus occultum]|uniref:53_t:CDS:1 n=1 Tax=Paraglomus occultum TaxID=144539 RepID=A0A9N9AWK4_9GLOM|nr:53_t:CDS:2 [Paraglomus occultum]